MMADGGPTSHAGRSPLRCSSLRLPDNLRLGYSGRLPVGKEKNALFIVERDVALRFTAKRLHSPAQGRVSAPWER
jgi:hypothetical protein